MLTLVLVDPRSREAAHPGMPCEASRDERGAAAMQAAHEHERVPRQEARWIRHPQSNVPLAGTLPASQEGIAPTR
jgi:hypothetical protein